MELLILAAGKGSRFKSKQIKHKCLIKVDGSTLISKIVMDGIKNKISKTSIVIGHNKNMIISSLRNYKINFIHNEYYKTTDMLYSLKIGLQNQSQDMIISYSDIIFSEKIFKMCKNLKQPSIPVLKNWESIWNQRQKNIYEDCEELIFDKKLRLKKIGNNTNIKKNIMAQYMGIIFLPFNKKKYILKEIELVKNKKLHITNFLNILCKKKKTINVLPIKDNNWYEFDDDVDLKNYVK